MPVSAEVLNDDIKELNAEFHQLGIGLAEVRQEVKDAIGLAKWPGTVLVATLLASGLGAVTWGASLTVKVQGMETRVNEKFAEAGIRIDKLETKLDKRIDKLETKLNQKIDKLDQRIERLETKMEARFDRMETSIQRALEQLKPPPPANSRPNP